MTKDETLKLALEALEKHGDAYLGHSDEYQFAITKVKEALAQPEQGPTKLWCETCEGTGEVYQEHQAGCHVGGHFKCPDCDDEGYVLSRLYSTTPPQPKEPEQEPDVYIPSDALRQLKGTSLLILRSVPLYGYRGDGLTPLYTTPPQRKPLTDGSLIDEGTKKPEQEPLSEEREFWLSVVDGLDKKPESPTQGMTLGQRISHVGGRENAAGYIEFGSPMAVKALIDHVLRDTTPPQRKE